MHFIKEKLFKFKGPYLYRIILKQGNLLLAFPIIFGPCFVSYNTIMNKAKAISANLLAFVFDLEETFSFDDFKF